MLRTTRYDIDLDAVAHNARRVRSFLDAGQGKRPAMAVVLKADAYGLGAVPVAGVLLREGADMLAVACLSEAVRLRRAYPDAPILVMGRTALEHLPRAVKEGVTTTIFDFDEASALSEAALSLKTTAVAHVKVDTGMNRLGLKPDSGSAELLLRMASLPALRLEGVFTHLALCDEAEDRKQYALFQRLLSETEAAGLSFPLRHVCDSIGLMRYPEFRLDMVRAGAVLYGVTPMNTPLSDTAGMRTPFRLSTRVSRLRRLEAGEGVGYDYTWRAPAGGALVATLPIGYADGYKRCLSNKGFVLVRGRRAPVVGLVCMDQCNVDVTAVPDAAEGDEVVLLGGEGPDSIPVLEMAGWADTNRNDVICSIGRRVPRVYSAGGRVVAEVDYVMEGLA